MTIAIFLTHTCFAVLLFIIINWIGKHSYSLGYVTVTIFVQNEEAPASNFFIRVFTPIVYLIIISSILYSIGADRYVHNIFLVNIYYLFIRLLFGIVTGRSLLINWYRQILYWTSITTISYIAYIKLISTKQNILPDFTTLANELWIIILVFLFHVFNNVRISPSNEERRKQKYLNYYYNKYKNLYGQIIREEIQNQTVEAIVYAIVIYENFNRPRLIRYIERISFKITKKPHTLGIMQVLSSQLITDTESVRLGAGKINAAYLRFKDNYKNNPNNYYSEWNAYYEILSDYNGGSSYSSEVSSLTNIILQEFYPNKTESLVPERTVE